MAFLTHLFFGFAAKWVLPGVNIFWLLLAPLITDLLFFALVGLGIEDYPDFPARHAAGGVNAWGGFSHGLIACIAYSAFFGGMAFGLTRRVKVGVVYALLVFSHWPTDLLAHPMIMVFGEGAPSSMPIFWDGPERGVVEGYGLWSTPLGWGVGELAPFFAGLLFYVIFRLTRRNAKDEDLKKNE